MTEGHRDVWQERDLPMLRHVVPLVDANPFVGTTIREIQQELGWTNDKAVASVRALEGVFLEVHWAAGGNARISNVSPEAREVAGLWPTAERLADNLLDVAEAMIQADIDDAERSKWQAIRDGAMSAGRDVLVQLAAMAMSGQLPR